MKHQLFSILAILAHLPMDVTGDTFYGCRAEDTTTAPPFTISCPSNTVINVQSALVGYSGSYEKPSTSNPNGSCPWTNKTSNTCDGLGLHCSPPKECNCNCTRSLPIPNNCTEQTASCSFQQERLSCNGKGSDPLCKIRGTIEQADFLVVNYTCDSSTTLTTTTAAAAATTTTTTSTTMTSKTPTIATPTVLALSSASSAMPNAAASSQITTSRTSTRTMSTSLVSFSASSTLSYTNSPSLTTATAAAKTITSTTSMTMNRTVRASSSASLAIPYTTSSFQTTASAATTSKSSSSTSSSSPLLSSSKTTFQSGTRITYLTSSLTSPLKTSASIFQPSTTTLQTTADHVVHFSHLSPGAIAGIVVGIVLFVFVVVVFLLLICCCHMKRSNDKSSGNGRLYRVSQWYAKYVTTDGQNSVAVHDYEANVNIQPTAPDVDLMTYEDADEFRAHDVLPNGIPLKTLKTKPHHASNDVKYVDRRDLYTAVVKKPAAKGQVGFPVHADDSDNAHQQGHQNQQKQMNPTNGNKMMTIEKRPDAGYETIDAADKRANIVSMYPPVEHESESDPNYSTIDDGVDYKSPAAKLIKVAEAGSQDSVHNLTLIDNVIYEDEFQGVDQKKSSTSDSESSLTLVDNATYAGGVNV